MSLNSSEKVSSSAIESRVDPGYQSRGEASPIRDSQLTWTPSGMEYKGWPGDGLWRCCVDSKRDAHGPATLGDP